MSEEHLGLYAVTYQETWCFRIRGLEGTLEAQTESLHHGKHSLLPIRSRVVRKLDEDRKQSRWLEDILGWEQLSGF